MQQRPVQLAHRREVHLARKTWHAGTGLLMSAILFWSPISRESAVLLLSMLLCGVVIFEMARLRSGVASQFALRIWGPVMREHELRHWSGTPYYLAGVLCAVSFFPKEIAVLSVLFLALGDPIASLVGLRFGSRGPKFSNGKSVLGALAGSTVCGLVLAFALQGRLEPVSLVFASVFGGVIGGFAETLPLDVDDNFTIPVISGFGLWFLYVILGL